MSSGSFPVQPLDRLPSGRHRLSREAVKQSQRGWLLYAIAQVVAERGYAGATVADIVDRASVSRSTFYEQFPDKDPASSPPSTTASSSCWGGCNRRGRSWAPERTGARTSARI